MINFIFRIAGKKRVTARAHCSRFAVCIRLCHPGTETGCVPLQADDDDSIQTAASQTAVSHCGIDGGRKIRKRERERWNGTEMGISVITDGPRSVSQNVSPPQDVLQLVWGELFWRVWGKIVEEFNYFLFIVIALVQYCLIYLMCAKNGTILSLQMAPSQMSVLNSWASPFFIIFCSLISYYCLCICDCVMITPACLPLTLCVKPRHISFLLKYLSLWPTHLLDKKLSKHLEVVFECKSHHPVRLINFYKVWQKCLDGILKPSRVKLPLVDQRWREYCC